VSGVVKMRLVKCGVVRKQYTVLSDVVQLEVIVCLR